MLTIETVSEFLICFSTNHFRLPICTSLLIMKWSTLLYLLIFPCSSSIGSAHVLFTWAVIIQHEKLGLDGSSKYYVVVGYVSLPLLLKTSTLVGSPWQWTSLAAYIKFCQPPIWPLTLHAGSKPKHDVRWTGAIHLKQIECGPRACSPQTGIAFRQKVMYGVALHNSRWESLIT